jgi:hypothetical protein
LKVQQVNGTAVGVTLSLRKLQRIPLNVRGKGTVKRVASTPTFKVKSRRQSEEEVGVKASDPTQDKEEEVIKEE